MRPLFLFLILLATPLWAVKINIVNDSAYTLNATIYDRNQTELGSAELNPDHSIMWHDNPYNAQDYYKGPFSIRFTCLTGSTFGTILRLKDGGTARAKGSSGPKKCSKQS